MVCTHHVTPGILRHSIVLRHLLATMQPPHTTRMHATHHSTSPNGYTLNTMCIHLIVSMSLLLSTSRYHWYHQNTSTLDMWSWSYYTNYTKYTTICMHLVVLRIALKPCLTHGTQHLILSRCSDRGLGTCFTPWFRTSRPPDHTTNH